MNKKDITERIREVTEIYTKLKELGIHRRFESLEQFYKICEDYAKNGVSASGKIKLPEIDRKLEYIFTTRNGKESVVKLTVIN